jgi:3-oxoacyl-[acyl-carrier-protein] synthase II
MDVTGSMEQQPWRRRVVVTGLGLLCGVGRTVSEVWEGLLAGRSGMAEIKGFDLTGHPVRFAAEVKDFDPLLFIDKKEARKMGRFIHFAIAAAQEAMDHSGLKIDESNHDRVGVHIGSGIGGFDIIEREHSAMLAGGPRKISPFFIPGSIINLAAGHVSIRFGARGPNEATATACTSSAHSIGDAFRIIQRGDADTMIAGGTEAAITPMGVGGFAAMKALSTRNDDPTHACRPFDKDRDGFVVGEGAGILILEELESARARGARILAEIIGYGMSADAYHMTGMAPEGEGCRRAMNAALKVAGISPDKIDYVNAHATSTPLGDALESKAIENVFGEHALNQTLLVSSTKSMTGHLLGGAGGLEAGITVMAMLEQTAPAHHESRRARSAVPAQLRAQRAAAREDRLRALQLLRLRRHQRLPRLSPLDGVASASHQDLALHRLHRCQSVLSLCFTPL